ncbi:MAG TPA: tripartite tricarboxylate transporter substrate binding protein [Roseomonas sp.]|jgi:tripartite-type tricarboxylate transporter receptor subunit TctC
MRPTRRSVLSTLLAAGTAGLASGWPRAGAQAQGSWPDRPIRLVTPFQPGGGTDIVARLLAPRLGEALGQPVVVENRSGANGVVGVRYVAAAPPDGYTLLLDAPGIVMNASLLREPLYDPVGSFEPIAQILSVPFVIVVNPQLPARTLAEFLALAKSRPRELNIAAGGPSTLLATELYRLQTGVEFTVVPYRGSAPAAAATVAGEVQAMFSDFPSVAGQVAGGLLRPLAVSTRERTPLLPAVPTAQESGAPDYVADIWYGLYAPRGTPAPILARLHGEVQRIVMLPEVRERIAGLGATPVAISPDAFRAHVADEVSRWRDVVVRGGIRRE